MVAVLGVPCVIPLSMALSWNFPGGTWETKKFSQDSQYLNVGPSENEAGVLTTQLQHLVTSM
jgi:hypothetical protein